MRIAFTGAHRVGKTTLAEEIASILRGYYLTKEPYLELETAGYLFSEVPTPDDYIEQFRYALRQIAESGDDVIFDRCPLDLLAYIHATSRSKNIQMLYKAMVEAMSQIDVLVFVPIETPDLIACHESDLPALRDEVNELVQDWMENLNIETIVVNGSLANRKKQVLDRIAGEIG